MNNRGSNMRSKVSGSHESDDGFRPMVNESIDLPTKEGGFENEAIPQSDSGKATKLAEQDKLSEKYSGISNRTNAYIGPIEQAEEFMVDNEHIKRGYRINHRSAGSICKSLFKCHNEAVNVWSHIGGVLLFIVLLINLCVNVLPHQFWYAATMEKEYEDLYAAGLSKLNKRDPIYFIDGKINALSIEQGALLAMEVTSDEDEVVFEQSIAEILHRVEDISHFSVEHFYSFNYLESYNELLDPSYPDLINHWHDTFNNYNSLMRE